jgi:transposase
VATRPVDFRKGSEEGQKTVWGTVFPTNGLALVHKRLEGGKFVWPQVRDGVMRLSGAQLSALFEGLDWRLVRPERARRPAVAG